MTENINDLVELLAVSAYVAWSNVLSGSNSPQQDSYFKKMQSPVVGDLVLETTSIGRMDAIDRVGRLLSVQRESMKIDDWPEDEETPTEKTWTIETFDDREFTWRNASFIIIPESEFEHKGRI